MADLRALRDRVAKLTGADREVDALAFAACGMNINPKNSEYGRWPDEEAEGSTYYRIAPLTSSVDAVLSLIAKVLPGWGVDLYQDALGRFGWSAVVRSPDFRTEEVPGQGGFERVPVAGKSGAGIQRPTPALALLLALLGAKITPSSEP